MYRLRLFVKPYGQLVHKEEATCSYCGECYDSSLLNCMFSDSAASIQTYGRRSYRIVPHRQYHTSNRDPETPGSS